MHTFEEQVGMALDALYPGALFLSAANETEAERLVVATVSGAFNEVTPGIDPSVRWFEARMAHRFLASTTVPKLAATKRSDIAPIPRMQPGDLFRGAAAIPAWARAAIWLVLLRRWSYQEACDALAVSQDVLSEMLEHRHVLTQALMGSAPPHEGAGEATR